MPTYALVYKLQLAIALNNSYFVRWAQNGQEIIECRLIAVIDFRHWLLNFIKSNRLNLLSRTHALIHDRPRLFPHPQHIYQCASELLFISNSFKRPRLLFNLLVAIGFEFMANAETGAEVKSIQYEFILVGG